VLIPKYHGLALAVSRIGRMLPFDVADLQLPLGDEGFRAIAGVVATAAQPVYLLDVGAIVERLETIYAV
jgi:chemotaxis signal transduction protein